MHSFHSDPAAKHMLFRTRHRVVMTTWRHTSVLYAPKRCLRSSKTHVLTQQDILLFFFLFFTTVAENDAGSSDDDGSFVFCFLYIICFVLLASPNRCQCHLENRWDRPTVCTRRRFDPWVWPMSQNYGQNLSCILSAFLQCQQCRLRNGADRELCSLYCMCRRNLAGPLHDVFYSDVYACWS